MGSLAFTASKCTQQQGFATMPGVTHVPFPNPYRPLFAGDDQGQAVLNYIENVLFMSNLPASEVAAILVEPIQCEGGYIVPPDGFLAGLRQLCDRHGILLILDEVQSGVGRSGKMFACQHWNVQPDIMTLAKGLGSGLPIGLVVAKKTIMQQWKPGAHANTYGGNPLCCAAALVTLDLIEREYAANAEKVGAHFIKRLRELQSQYPVIGEIRGKGLMIGMAMRQHRILLAGLLLLFALPALAERKPVSAQIQLPHNYYYREMYLPQLTSGPSALTFSPDGKELVYSMGGSLWRQIIDSDEARELT